MKLDEQIHIKIDSAHRRKIDTEAATYGISAAALVRLIIQKHLEKGGEIVIGKKKAVG